jgi:hypothetical protein
VAALDGAPDFPAECRKVKITGLIWLDEIVEKLARNGVSPETLLNCGYKNT